MGGGGHELIDSSDVSAVGGGEAALEGGMKGGKRRKRRGREGAEAPKCSVGDQGPTPESRCVRLRGRGRPRDPDPAALDGVPAVLHSSDPILQWTLHATAQLG